MTAEEIRVIITAQNEEFNRRLNDVVDRIDDMDNRTRSYGDSAVMVFKRIAQTISALGIGKIISDSIMSGGELEQNLGGVEVVFRQHAETMRNTAKSAYKDMGLSESGYLAAANKMGALLKGSGFDIARAADITQQAMQRAADVASIMGVDVAAAMEAVTGAAKGNFTMMDNLGVAINDTTLQIYAQEKGLGKLETTQQKVNAAMQMFLEKTEYAAGNYARENDTFSGSLTTFKAELENLKSSLGTELLPTASALISMARTGLETISPLVISFGDGLNRVAGYLINLSPAAKNLLALSLLSATVIPAVTKAQTLLTAAGAGYRALLTILIPKQLTFAAALKATAGWIGVIAGALALLSMFKDKTDSTADSFEEESEGAKEATNEINNLAESTEELGNVSKKMVADIDKLNVFGSSSADGILTANLVSADDIAEISSATEEISALQEEINRVQAEDLSVDVEVSADTSVLNGLGEIISNVLTGIGEYVDMWFGESLDEWQLYGDAIAEKIKNADLEGAMQIALEGVNNQIIRFINDSNPVIGKWYEDFNNKLRTVGSWLSSIDPNRAAEIGYNELESENPNLYTEFIKRTKSGESMEDVFDELFNTEELRDLFWFRYLDQYVSSNVFGLNRSQIEDEIMTGKFSAKTEDGIKTLTWEQWLRYHDYGYSSYSYSNPVDYSTTDQSASLQNYRGLETEEKPVVIEQTTYVQIDGETIGEAAATYDLRQAVRSNGY